MILPFCSVGIAIFLLLGISVLVALAGLRVLDYESYVTLAFK